MLQSQNMPQMRQNTVSSPRAFRPSCSPCSLMRHLSLSRQESWNWLSPHDMHIWQYTHASPTLRAQS